MCQLSFIEGEFFKVMLIKSQNNYRPTDNEKTSCEVCQHREGITEHNGGLWGIDTCILFGNADYSDSHESFVDFTSTCDKFLYDDFRYGQDD
jgi:hypothetical protein